MELVSELHVPPIKGRIQDLIELFFQDLRAFGLFASHIRPTQKSFEEGYIGEHMANINSLIKAAEEHRHLIPDNTSRPILYNYNSWPENAPLAGYYTIDSGIKYSQILTTYIANWHYELSKGALHSRLLRAALWVWSNSELEHTLNYIFDLQRHGYFMIPEAIDDVIALLIRSQALGKNGQEVVSAYFRGKIPASSSDWLTSEIEEPSRLLGDLNFVNVQPVLESLIFDTLEELERVRNLKAPEEWLLDQAAAMLRCRHIVLLCKRFLEENQQAPALRSILAQFEEIAADAGIYRWYQHRPEFAPLSSPMTMQIAPIIWSFREKLGEQGEERLYRERLLYPNVLREQIARSDGKDFPQEWSIIPPRLLWPFAMSINQGILDPAGRSKPFPAEQMEQMPEVRSFFEKNSVTAHEDRMQLLYELYWQKVPDRWKTGGSPGVQLADVQSVQFMEVLRVSHRTLCRKELLDEELHKTYSTSDLGEEEQKRILIKVSSLYPWSPAVYLELAIYYDERGDHLLAWDYILTALLLSPAYNAGWHAASIILGRLGNDADADFAWAVYTVTKEGANK